MAMTCIKSLFVDDWEFGMEIVLAFMEQQLT